jgi:glycerol-3-phosphate dehydrogenase
VISGEEVTELLPALHARQPTGGYLFYDCQTDDVRLVLSVLAEAERFGALCANRARVLQLALEHGRAAGVIVRDLDGGGELTIRADTVINATGVWADRIRPGELHSDAEVPRISPSRGTHITIADKQLPLVGGAVVPAGEGRTIFALPWLGRSLIGTTDSNYDGELEHVRPNDADISYLLDAVNAFFGTSLTTGDLTGAYAGVRPLISTGDSRRSVDISRKAELYETSSGMITITGGKLTTWRRMAKLAVDALVERDGRYAPCRTHEIALGAPIEPDRLTRVGGVADEAYAALAARYGHDAERVLAIAAEDRWLAEPLLEGLPDLCAEAVYAVRHEQAHTVADVLLRRTRLGVLAGRELSEADCDAPQRVATLIGGELSWDAARASAEIAAFRVEALAEGISGRPGQAPEPELRSLQPGSAG